MIRAKSVTFGIVEDDEVARSPYLQGARALGGVRLLRHPPRPRSV